MVSVLAVVILGENGVRRCQQVESGLAKNFVFAFPQLIKTDKKVLGTYKKSPPKTKKAPQVKENAQRKTATYNVVYPAFGK